MNVDLNLINTEKAKEICEHLLGTPTENRVVVAFSQGDKKTDSGLFIPTNVKEDLPKKGVIVGFGPITEENYTYQEMLSIGSIITYGLYAGKDVEPSFKDNYQVTDLKFSVLSLNEIIYVEPNK